jgi:hypothetical protein
MICGMSEQRKMPSARFFCGAAVFAALLAYRIDLIGSFIDGMIVAFGPWAWASFLAFRICTMVAIAVSVIRRRRDGAE